MTSAGSETFSHDQNGNLTSRTEGSTTTDYSYDFEDQLIEAGGKSYEHDAKGRVVSSAEGDTETDFLFDGQQVIREQEEGTSAAISYLRGLGGRLVSQRAGSGAPSYYHHDSIGSVTALSGSSGTVTDTYSYDAFGNERERTGTSEQPYGYAGNRHDPDSGLSDFHARTYDPVAGRFTSKDPVRGFAGMPQTLNPYAYGINGPLAHPDPSGLCVGPALPFCAQVAFEAASQGLQYLDEKYGPPPGYTDNTLTGEHVPASSSPDGTTPSSMDETGAYYLSDEPPADSGEDTTPLYRAVGPEELQDVKEYGDYGYAPSGGGKYFATTEEGAQNFADAPINQYQEMTVTNTEVPNSFLDENGYYFYDPGEYGAGDSYHFSDEELPELYETMGPVEY